MTFKEPSPETVRDVLVDRAEYIRILEAKIVEKESEILGRWESEAEYRRLTDAAHDDLRAESVRLSEELGEALFERDTLRLQHESNCALIDALRAEVERLRKRISDEWLSLTAALGDHAHPGLSPSENVVELHERLTEARWEVKGLEAERDALRAEVGERRAENARLTSFPRSGHEAQAKLEKAEAALRKLTVDAALQGRVFKGNEGLPGAEEFYRAYNAGIKAQFEYARNIARAALRDTAPEVKP